MKLHYLKISPVVAQINRNHKDLKGYAIWLYLKFMHSNSCIYKYTVSGLAKKAGVSRTLIRKYVSLFLRNGWCKIHSGNLIFCKQSMLPEKDRKKKFLQLVPIFYKEWSIKGILSALQVFLIKDAQRKQKWASAGGDKQKRAISRENIQGMTFTVFKGKNVFKCSAAAAGRILRRLNDEGWYNRKHVKLKQAKDVCHPDMVAAINEYFSQFPPGSCPVTYKGRILVCTPSKIDWLPEVVMNEDHIYIPSSNSIYRCKNVSKGLLSAEGGSTIN